MSIGDFKCLKNASTSRPDDYDITNILYYIDRDFS